MHQRSEFGSGAWRGPSKGNCAALGLGCRTRTLDPPASDRECFPWVAGRNHWSCYRMVWLRTLIAFGPPDIPRLDQATIDWETLSFTCVISLVATGIFGILPAWKASRAHPGAALRTGIRSGGPSLTRTRSLLVIAEFATAVVLLVAAGLLVRSFLALENVDLGFDPSRVLTMNIVLPSGTPDARNAFYDDVLERVRALPLTQQARSTLSSNWEA